MARFNHSFRLSRFSSSPPSSTSSTNPPQLARTSNTSYFSSTPTLMIDNFDDNSDLLMSSAFDVLINDNGVQVRALVNEMFEEPTEEAKVAAYALAYDACQSIVIEMEALLAKNPYQPNKKARLLIAMSDGTVVVDTSKGDKNTYANMINKNINENHMSRFFYFRST